jgi:C1A family cysteine protease
VYGQEFGMGAILDPVRYNSIKTTPVLITRNYDGLPKSVSLVQYSPKPESQGSLGTCVAWSSTFTARTISESVVINRIDPQQSTNNAFSAYYTYKNSSNDPTFKRGMQIYDALDFLKEKGAVRRKPEEKIIEWLNMPASVYANSQPYKILDYSTLFKYYSNSYDGLTFEQKVRPVRKSLSEKNPVIIAFEVYPSFYNTKGVWEPFRGQNRSGFHAMCVVGYDDNMYGGAFLIQNSWGENWGNDGFIWIKYEDFAKFVYEAYEIQEDPNNFNIVKKEYIFNASIDVVQTNNNRSMPVVFDKQGFYKTRTSYPTGTKFRYLITNRYPAHVYAFSTDSNESDLERIFPIEGEDSFINYRDSTKALPSEKDSMQIFGDAGTEYLVVLFSNNPLDIDAIEKRFVSEKGTFPERVARAVGNNFISNVKFDNNKIQFSETTTNPNAVLGLLLAIDHK